MFASKLGGIRNKVYAKTMGLLWHQNIGFSNQFLAQTWLKIGEKTNVPSPAHVCC
ncbi:MAG TPA: hypothetical protein VGK99_10185 [Acidobacteriota bacterium]|jgi:hypothetical protein